MLALPLFAFVAAVGSAGTFVLMDQEEKKFSITTSQFGELWVKLIQINPMFNVMFLVGGFYGLLYIYVRFSDDKRARAADADSSKAKNSAGKKEAKKDK